MEKEPMGVPNDIGGGNSPALTNTEPEYNNLNTLLNPLGDPVVTRRLLLRERKLSTKLSVIEISMIG